MIILTAGEANQVRGLTIKGHAMAPVPLLDGTFALPDECLADPAHARHRGLLRGLALRDVDAAEYLSSKSANEAIGKPSELTAADARLLAGCTYKSGWREGQAVEVSR